MGQPGIHTGKGVTKTAGFLRADRHIITWHAVRVPLGHQLEVLIHWLPKGNPAVQSHPGKKGIWRETRNRNMLDPMVLILVSDVLPPGLACCSKTTTTTKAVNFPGDLADRVSTSQHQTHHGNWCPVSFLHCPSNNTGQCVYVLLLIKPIVSNLCYLVA